MTTDEKTRPRIKEVIVVEGRDDTAAVRRAVDADTIETHGFGISGRTWALMASAYETRGLIIFTDPDHAGEEIRRRVRSQFPDSKEAFLTMGKASRNGDIGIENAEPQDILRALQRCNYTVGEKSGEFTMEDLIREGLVAGSGARDRRQALADELGIGYGNATRLLAKLNSYGISRRDFDEALRKGNNQGDQE